MKIYAPYNNELIDDIPVMNSSEILSSIEKAKALFDDRKRWLPKYERITILENTAKIMEERKEELTRIAAQEGGKPYVDSRVEVDRAINGVKLAIEHIGQMGGKEIPMGQTKSSANRLAFTMREPIGVVSSISAFNHPLNLIIHQTVPAIAVGAPVLIKPASTTPLSCLKFVDILYEAGLPKDWCRAIIAKNEDAELLATDTRINFLSFIGSAKIGWYLRSKLSPGTRCALEHGGVAPVIVEKDAAIDDMLPLLIKGGFYHAGQVCVSVQRVFVHDSIEADVAEKLSNLALKLKVGDPLNKNTDVGPLIKPVEVDRVENWINEAKEKGGEILSGGERISKSCFAPTVVLNPSPDIKISTQEVFGPVICLYSYSDRQEAINIANSLPYAFQASVFTSDIDIALDTVSQLNATAVMINDHTAFRVDWMPFGGRDSSGLGMGGIPYSMHEMTRDKMIVIKSNAVQ
ncbi:Aldehyde dehydrogenase [hydrothermal vent metagenome]|uniref:Aldehyde dehydrogenase n=1 Tax=hydrothermal vent metagenome TaxID=652676 RepID=A0A3B1C6U6_9ZZZZ